MNVLIVNNAVPFIRGGAEQLADHLVGELNATPGVRAELMRIPFSWEPAERLLDEVLLNRLLRIYGADRVIALKFPAYLIPHPNKVLWLLHQFRQAYDLYDAEQSHLRGTPGGMRARNVVREADRQCFAECKKIFVNSPVTARRLAKYSNTGSEILYPPLNRPELFGGGDFRPYIFAGGRLSPGKRQDLLIRAMRHVRSPIKLIVAGPPDTPEFEAQLRSLIRIPELSDRVELRLGFRPVEEIAELANNSLACAYLPFDEDSLGYVAMEAFASGKPVLTSKDSGGLLEIVHDGETGLVRDPDPLELGAAIDELAANVRRTRQMGAEARAELVRRKLNWPATIDRLLA